MSHPPALPRRRPRPGPRANGCGAAWRLAGRALLCMAVSASITGCAVAGPYNPEDLPAGQMTQVNDICRSLVGLQPGERAFSDCIDSLSLSAAKLDRTAALGRARGGCLAKGVAPGGPALAECEIAATDDNAAPTALASAPAAPSPAAAPVKSYFYVSWREAHQRQRMACAALGYEPAGAGFYDCVAGLQAALFRAEHPST